MKELSNITTVVCDFDGVLTNNNVFISDNGQEYVSCSRSDGIGFKLLQQNNIETFILSTEVSNIVQFRSKKMGVRAFNGVQDKKSFLRNYCAENSLDPRTIAYIGNDLNDLEAMNFVGYKVCPNDAWPEIIDISDLILKSKGGEGVVREFSSYLLNHE